MNFETLFDKFISKLNITIKDNNGNELKADDVIGTGTKVIATDTDGNIIHEYSIIIYGDVNGDGKISPSDYVKVKNSILGKEELYDIYISSADVNKNGEITPSDYVKIKNWILGKETIIQ